MWTHLVSSLAPFVSPFSLSLPFHSSFSPCFLLLVSSIAVVVFLFLVARGIRPASSITCLPRLPVLGSLPWLGGGLPPHLLFTQLAHR